MAAAHVGIKADWEKTAGHSDVAADSCTSANTAMLL